MKKPTLGERILALEALHTPQGMATMDVARALGEKGDVVRVTLHRLVVKGALQALPRGHYTTVRVGPPRGPEEVAVWHSAFGAAFTGMALRYTSMTPSEAADAYEDTITTQALELAEAALVAFRKATTPSQHPKA